MFIHAIIIGILIFIYLFLILPLGIVSIVMGAVHPGTCDIKDIMGLNVSQYLLGLGISGVICSIIISILLIVFMVGVLLDSTTLTTIASIQLIIFNIVILLFTIGWSTVGGVILFRTNIDCINSVSIHVIYALVLWCLSIVSMINICCSIRIKFRNSE